MIRLFISTLMLAMTFAVELFFGLIQVALAIILSPVLFIAWLFTKRNP
jgi:hypothetical protein